MARDRVPESRQHGPLGGEFPFERVADRVEGGVVRARDGELRERRSPQRLEGDLGLPRPALDGQQLRAALELRRQRRGGIEGRAHGGEEPPEEGLGVARAGLRVQLLAPGGELVDHRDAAGDSRRGRFDDRERAERIRFARRRQERDHASVRVPDEVIPVAQETGHETGVGLEVHALDRRSREEAGTLDRDQLEALGQRTLRRPRRPRAHDAPVDEDETLHREGF